MKDDEVEAQDGERQSNRDVGLFVLGALFGLVLIAAFVAVWR